ncbi:2495_t:CDS:2, partial [Dentiscutata heterogama]
MKLKKPAKCIMKTNQEIVKDDVSIFSDASLRRSESIYNDINAPHYRDFLNDITFGEGDSWFDKQNNTTILSFFEKKVDDVTTVIQKQQPVKKCVPELTVPRP